MIWRVYAGYGSRRRGELSERGEGSLAGAVFAEDLDEVHGLAVGGGAAGDVEALLVHERVPVDAAVGVPVREPDALHEIRRDARVLLDDGGDLGREALGLHGAHAPQVGAHEGLGQ